MHIAAYKCLILFILDYWKISVLSCLIAVYLLQGYLEMLIQLLVVNIWFSVALANVIAGHLWLSSENLWFLDPWFLERDSLREISLPGVYWSVGKANEDSCYWRCGEGGCMMEIFESLVRYGFNAWGSNMKFLLCSQEDAIFTFLIVWFCHEIFSNCSATAVCYSPFWIL